MNTTANYGFKKPESTDFYNIADMNDNMDAIDEALEDKADKEHTHDYAESAGKLSNTENIGSDSQPVYFNADGVPVPCENVSDKIIADGSNVLANSLDGAPIIYLKNSGYTSQDGTPTPSAPLEIIGLGHYGYFDGLIGHGKYTDNFDSSSAVSTYMINTHKIPCSEGDIVEVSCTEELSYCKIFAFDSDEEFVSLGVANVPCKSFSYTVPEGAKWIVFNTNTVDPTHICVKINGNYGMAFYCGGKNLYEPIELEIQKKSGVTCTNNYDGTFTLSGTNSSSYATYFNNMVRVPANISHFARKCPIKLMCKEVELNATLSRDKTTTGTQDGRGHSIVFEKDEKCRSVNFGLVIPAKATFDNLIVKPIITTDLDATVDDFKDTTYDEIYNVNIPIDGPLYDGDYIEIFADGSGEIVRNNSVLNVTKWSELQNKLTESIEVRTNTPTDADILKPIYCTIAKKVYNTWDVDEVGIMQYGGTNGAKICVRVPVDATLTDYPCKIVYGLKEPTRTPLTAEQIAEFKKLHTFDTVTSVNADGEVVVRYYCNSDGGYTVRMLQEMIEDKDHVESADTATKADKATIAEKLSNASAIGTTTKPVYFKDGVPIACDYSLCETDSWDDAEEYAESGSYNSPNINANYSKVGNMVYIECVLENEDGLENIKGIENLPRTPYWFSYGYAGSVTMKSNADANVTAVNIVNNNKLEFAKTLTSNDTRIVVSGWYIAED